MKKERIEYLDALKGICIMLVVFCHLVVLSPETIAGNYIMTLAWAAVPCFMMVSGALMHQSSSFSWKKYLFKIGKIYIVLCIWRFVYLLVYWKLKALHFGTVQLLQYLLLLTDLDGVNTSVMWYMIAYLVVLLLFPVTYFLFCNHSGERKVLLFMAVVSGVGGIIIPSGNWFLKQLGNGLNMTPISFNGLAKILPYTNYANMIFYFITGAFIFEYRELISEKIHRLRAWLLPCMLISTFGLMTVKFAETNSFAWEGKYISGGYSHMLTFVMSVCLFLFFMEYRKQMANVDHVLATYIGRYTMGVYYMHYILLAVCQVLIYPRITSFYSCGLNCLKTIIITTVCVIVTALLRKVPLIKYLV